MANDGSSAIGQRAYTRLLKGAWRNEANGNTGSCGGVCNNSGDGLADWQLTPFSVVHIYFNHVMFFSQFQCLID